MRIKLISCQVFLREFEALAPQARHSVEAQYLPIGLHSASAREMHDALQEAIDAVDATAFDAVALGFGLCNVGLPGLRARTMPLVIPRVNDCIAMFMGSSKLYRDYFEAKPDSYFKSSGWIEYVYQTGKELEQTAISQQMGMDQSYQQLLEKYGAENAAFLYEAMNQYKSRYARLTYIATGLEGTDEFEQAARAEAAQKGWDFEKITGNMRLLDALLAGAWDPAEFLVVHPGEEVVLTYDEGLIGTRKLELS